MIRFLKQYESECVDKIDFRNAKETRNRIRMYQLREEEIKKEILTIKQEKQVLNYL